MRENDDQWSQIYIEPLSYFISLISIHLWQYIRNFLWFLILLATKQTTYAWGMSQTKDKNNGIYEVICSSTSVNCSILWKIEPISINENDWKRHNVELYAKNQTGLTLKIEKKNDEIAGAHLMGSWKLKI